MSNKGFKSARHSAIQFVKTFASDKSFATQASVKERLITSIKDLHALGYKIKNINNLQPKHIEKLVSHWQEKELSTGSIKNRMSDFRLIAKTTGRTHLVESKNKAYEIPDRSFIPTSNKATKEFDVNKFNNEKYLKASLELQKQFGLRREECLKIKPEQALKTNSSGESYLKLNSSWTKGGISRIIPITNPAQLEAIKAAQNLVGNKSMIPQDKSYYQHRRHYEYITRENGYKNLHGLRHAYAQKRYVELTGWKSPIDGGPNRNSLSKEQKISDGIARQTISEELGHSRASITKNYIG